MFRLRTTTGQTQTISAGRVLVADGEVRFQPPGQHRPDDGGER